MRPETILAELNRLRKDLEADDTDLEWLAMEHAFRFISYQIADFGQYIREADERGEFKAYKEAAG